MLRRIGLGGQTLGNHLVNHGHLLDAAAFGRHTQHQCNAVDLVGHEKVDFALTDNTMNWTATVEEMLAEERIIFVSGVSSPYVGAPRR